MCSHTGARSITSMIEAKRSIASSPPRRGCRRTAFVGGDLRARSERGRYELWRSIGPAMAVPGRFERAISTHLSDSFELPESCEPALIRALQADLRAPLPVAAASITRALKLAAALDGVLGSPEAARRIRRVLQSEPAAVKLIQTRVLRPTSLDARRDFARREGRPLAALAPKFGDRPPARTMPLRAFLTSMSPPRRARGKN